MNIFEQASRNAYRFNTKKGAISTEDLWQLPLTSLNNVSLNEIAQGLYKQIQDSTIPSFVEVQSQKNQHLETMFEIVKHIIAVKLEQNKIQAEARETAVKRQRIMELIESKKDASLAEKSIEELEKML